MSYRAMGAAALVITVAVLGMGARSISPANIVSSGPKDALAAYGFELVEPVVKFGGGTSVTVRLVQKQTGNTVPDAVLFMSRMDMSPDGMSDMTAPLEPASDTLPGYFRFTTDLIMAGDWELLLMAKLPGEAGYVRTTLVLTAVP